MGRRPTITEIPTFATEAEEREWWEAHHAEVDYEALPVEALEFDIEVHRPKSRPISIRLQPELVDRYRALAQERGMGYQTLMREVLDRWAKQVVRGRE